MMITDEQVHRLIGTVVSSGAAVKIDGVTRLWLGPFNYIQSPGDRVMVIGNQARRYYEPLDLVQVTALDFLGLEPGTHGWQRIITEKGGTRWALVTRPPTAPRMVWVRPKDALGLAPK